MKKSWLVVPDSLKADRDGLDIEVRLPWYRGLPLSDIEVGEIRINGEVIAPEKVTFRVNGKERPAKELEEYYEENWYVLDSAYVHVPYASAEKGQQYEVKLTLVLYPPYIPGIPFQNSFNERMSAH